MNDIIMRPHAGEANGYGFVIDPHDALVATMTIDIAANAKIDTFFDTIESAVDDTVGLGREAVVADMLRRRNDGGQTYIIEVDVIVRQPMTRNNIDFFQAHSYPIFMGLDDVFSDPLPTMSEIFGKKKIAYISQAARDRKT